MERLSLGTREHPRRGQIDKWRKVKGSRSTPSPVNKKKKICIYPCIRTTALPPSVQKQPAPPPSPSARRTRGRTLSVSDTALSVRAPCTCVTPGQVNAFLSFSLCFCLCFLSLSPLLQSSKPVLAPPGCTTGKLMGRPQACRLRLAQTPLFLSTWEEGRLCFSSEWQEGALGS